MSSQLGAVLVSGGLGYIGRHVVRELSAAKIPVVSLDSTPGTADPFPGERVVRGTYGDVSLVRQVLREQRIEAVIHLAARTDVGESVRDPLGYYQVNVGEMLNLVEVMLEVGVRRMIFASSAAVYGEGDREPLLERRAPSPVNPYGFSKVVGERVLADLCRARGLSSLAFRYFNVAGQCADGTIRTVAPKINLIFPLLADVLHHRRELSAADYQRAGVIADDFETSDGACVRDYVHVMDVARAHRLGLAYLATAPAPIFEPFNIGSGRPTSLKRVVNVARAVSGQRFSVQWQKRPPGYPSNLVSHCQKAAEILGWTATASEPEPIMRSELEYAELFHGARAAR